MKYTEALRLARTPAPEAAPVEITVVLASERARFDAFLQAHLRGYGMAARLMESRYGDLIGNLQAWAAGNAQGVLLLEYAGLDPRLGARGTAPGSRALAGEIIVDVQARLHELGQIIRSAGPRPLTIVLPGLPLFPFPLANSDEQSTLELQLDVAARQFALESVAFPHVTVLNPPPIPPRARLDVRSELQFGDPYTNEYADALAAAVAASIVPTGPKKGLITDLDQTLWVGIAGEDGPENLAWGADDGGQIHGLYQQLLGWFADSGVLLGVASKNDPAAVERVFKERQLRLRHDAFFPLEANWGSKVDSVARILAAWNVLPDSVVFVDDDPRELALVQAAYPALECRRFDRDDPDAVWDLMHDLSRAFGRRALSEEDALRTQSLRAAVQPRDTQTTAGANAEEFFAASKSVITITSVTPAAERPFELVNKTNQFNLNGKRRSRAEWNEALGRDGAFAFSAAYSDRFGDLGTIAVLSGRQSGRTAILDAWVISCRAFSRRIEFACIDFLFAQLEIDTLDLAFVATAKNGPTQDFLATFNVNAETPRITRAAFAAARPKLHHQLLAPQRVAHATASA